MTSFRTRSIHGDSLAGGGGAKLVAEREREAIAGRPSLRTFHASEEAGVGVENHDAEAPCFTGAPMKSPGRAHEKPAVQ
jgi:hypothetical protein